MPSSVPTERPRVLLLAESPYYGGITSHLLSLARAMADSPFDVRLASLPGRRDDNSLVDLCCNQGIQLHQFQMDGAFRPSILPQLRRYVADNNFALVHTHNYRATLRAASPRLAVPIVNTCHGRIAERSLRLQAWQWAELRAMRRHRLTIACSDHVRQWLQTQGLDPRRIRTIRNCYDPGKVTLRVTGREQRDHPANLVALYAGRLCEGKGIEIFIRALDNASGISGISPATDISKIPFDAKPTDSTRRCSFPAACASRTPCTTWPTS